MRVIVGRYRGRKLVAPEGLATRPILDRVKQALFDRLGARWGLPGDLPAFDVLDLYAGAGNLGIEALSRGAAFCCFVESAPAALDCLRRNIDQLGEPGPARIVPTDAATALVPPPPSGAFRLVFLDPPYPLSVAVSAATPLGRTLARLGPEIPLSPDALVVWRFAREVRLPPTLPGGWVVKNRYDYGTMALAFLTRGPA